MKRDGMPEIVVYAADAAIRVNALESYTDLLSFAPYVEVYNVIKAKQSEE